MLQLILVRLSDAFSELKTMIKDLDYEMHHNLMKSLNSWKKSENNNNLEILKFETQMLNE